MAENIDTFFEDIYFKIKNVWIKSRHGGDAIPAEVLF